MDKYGSEGHAEACGALVRGTAARGDMDKLRKVTIYFFLLKI